MQHNIKLTIPLPRLCMCLRCYGRVRLLDPSVNVTSSLRFYWPSQSVAGWWYNSSSSSSSSGGLTRRHFLWHSARLCDRPSAPAAGRSSVEYKVVGLLFFFSAWQVSMLLPPLVCFTIFYIYILEVAASPGVMREAQIYNQPAIHVNCK